MVGLRKHIHAGSTSIFDPIFNLIYFINHIIAPHKQAQRWAPEDRSERVPLSRLALSDALAVVCFDLFTCKKTIDFIDLQVNKYIY